MMSTFAPIPRWKKEAAAAVPIANWFLREAIKPKAWLMPRLARMAHSTFGRLPGMKELSPVRRRHVTKRLQLGEEGAAQRLRTAQKDLAEAKPGAYSQWKQKGNVRRAEADVEWTGMTGGTLPGAAKALVAQPGRAMRLGWRGMNPLGKGMMGYFGATGLRDVARTPEQEYGQPGSPYKSRLHHAGSELGANVAWLAGGPLGLVPSIAAMTAGQAVGGIPGRMMARPPPPMPGYGG